MALGQRTLIITSSRQVASGTGSNNKPYTIYEVTATREDGTPVEDMKLRTFEDLPLNQPMRFEIDKFNSRKYGESYTLSRKGGGGQSQSSAEPTSGTRATGLQDQIDALEEKFRHLLARVIDVERNSSPKVSQRAAATAPSAAPAAEPEIQPAPPGGDDDIPF